ncbi:hypothetical protein ACFSCZ_10990 [Siminovitchia sediminis]|uniref:Uncharacterized protein n=1 Tax=Siminovitchia sediminis TaxID=1274353 RepID=A0ABW4KGS8_9BACI
MGERNGLEFQRFVCNGRFELNAYMSFLMQQAEVSAALDKKIKINEFRQRRSVGIESSK